jgi:hypothetical protein
MSMADYLEKLASSLTGEVEVGFMADAKYSNGLSIAQVAYWNEYGTTKANGKQGSPPRPFFRNAVAQAKPKLGEFIARKAKENNYNGTATLEAMGTFMLAEIDKSILDGDFAPNSPVTINGSKPDKNGHQFIEGKGFDRPLIGKYPEMYKAATFKVKE